MHLQALEYVAAILEAGRGGVEREWSIRFDFGRGPLRGGMERGDDHVVAETLM